LAERRDLLHDFFTSRSRVGNSRGHFPGPGYTAVEASAENASTLYAGELEIRLGEGLVLATGRALTLSVREFELLAAMARRAGAILTREELYSAVWGGELRAGDRSVDVYVSKLRGKLETAMPDRRFIHTHPGFGYRFQPQPARAGASGPSPTGGGAGAATPRGDVEGDVSGLSRDVHIGAPGS
jgi:DNA-binding response OmpR family regulator